MLGNHEQKNEKVQEQLDDVSNGGYIPIVIIVISQVGIVLNRKTDVVDTEEHRLKLKCKKSVNLNCCRVLVCLLYCLTYRCGCKIAH